MGAIEDFVSIVTATYETGTATEHSYRSAIEGLFNALEDDVTAQNEPKRIECGAPDFIVHHGDIVVGHLEAKDVGISLRSMTGANKRQQDRYRKALPNLIYTNCLDWDFYRDGELIASVTIAEQSTGIQALPEHYEHLKSLLQDFVAQRPVSISSPIDLAERMAGKAQLIKDVLFNALKADENVNTDLSDQYSAFKEHLIHDITPNEFADIYAETITYGMFAARLHDTTPDTFSRQEAVELLPKSNPFLRNLFTFVAGYELDHRIVWIIDDLVDVFRAADVAKIMSAFGKMTGRNDPFLHFYETFLATYNPSKRKSRGVWYTPEPVVNFIVRAVDHVLQSEFGLADGLADTSKIEIEWDTGQRKLTKKGLPTKDGRNAYIKKRVHRVQILDPATGTGTFLSEVVKLTAAKIQDIAPGMWSSYIEDDLIPRLHGFELLMASYAMCHMKLDIVLAELGYKPSGKPPRLSVYLTNSLEEGDPVNQALPFAKWLSNEVKAANTIKRDMPIMCVIGNPPYSGVSKNMGDWITGLIEDYKYVDGVHFGERKHWLHDDYVKFIRLSESLIEKNGEGVLGFITNHGYLDNPTFRGMRWHLLNTFDKVWILDLHGNAKKGEVSPCGAQDKNVFDIQQGVAIIIAVKKKDRGDGLAELFHGDLWGSRQDKYKELEKGVLSSEFFSALEPAPPQYAFAPRNYELAAQYEQGIDLSKLMPVNSTGILSMGDRFAIAESEAQLVENLHDLLENDYTKEEFKARYRLGKNYSEWIINNKTQLSRMVLEPVPIAYRPFDTRYTVFSNKVLWRWREKVMRHMELGENFALLTTKAHRDEKFAHVFVSDTISEVIGLSPRTASNSICFPLYLYSDELDIDRSRSVNFDRDLYRRLQESARHPEFGTPNELAIFDYVYGALHCPEYREVYAPFLRIGYPRIPWPSSPTEFWSVSSKGAVLRSLHLMEPEAIGSTNFAFTGEGSNEISEPRFSDHRIWVNDTQYFDSTPESAWNFYIGGYQPAQKWLKDRRGRVLSFDDVKHYQKILKVVDKTEGIMQEISISLAKSE